MHLVSLTTGRTTVLLQPSGHKLLKYRWYKKPAMHFEQTADSDIVSIRRVSSVLLVTEKKLEALNKA